MVVLFNGADPIFVEGLLKDSCVKLCSIGTSSSGDVVLDLLIFCTVKGKIGQFLLEGIMGNVNVK